MYKFIKPLLFTFFTFLVSVFIATLFNYFGIVSKEFVIIFNIIILIICYFFSGFFSGKKSIKKGFLSGIEMGLILSIIMFLFNLIFKCRINIITIIFYLVLLCICIIGSMVGINKRNE